MICCFLRRLGTGVLHGWINLNWTKPTLVNAKISAMIGIIFELHNSISQECGMRKVGKCKFGEKQIATTGDLKGSHFLSPNFEDIDCSIGQAVEDGLLQLFCECEVGALVVASAPGVLFAVGADLNGHFHEGNLL